MTDNWKEEKQKKEEDAINQTLNLNDMNTYVDKALLHN